jgi:hypothetical protein
VRGWCARSRPNESGLNEQFNFVIPAKAGIQCLLYERRWVPAWPFLETSPFGLVFAGTTAYSVRILKRAPSSSMIWNPSRA